MLSLAFVNSSVRIHAGAVALVFGIRRPAPPPPHTQQHFSIIESICPSSASRTWSYQSYSYCLGLVC